MTFATKYGPWALVAGASDGVGAAFADGTRRARRQRRAAGPPAGGARSGRGRHRIPHFGPNPHSRYRSRASGRGRGQSPRPRRPGDRVPGLLRRRRPELPALPGQSDRGRRSDGATQLHGADAAVSSLRSGHGRARQRRNRHLRVRRRIGRRTQHGRLRRLQGIRHGLRRSAVVRAARQRRRRAGL